MLLKQIPAAIQF